MNNNIYYHKFHLPVIANGGQQEERKRQNEVIENENNDFLKRLRGVKSVFDIKKWKSDRKQVENYLSMMAQYPSSVRNSLKNTAIVTPATTDQIQRKQNTSTSAEKQIQERNFELKQGKSGIRVIQKRQILYHKPIKINEETYFLEIQIEDDKFKIIAENVEAQKFLYQVPQSVGADMLSHEFHEDIEQLIAKISINKQTGKILIMRKKAPLEVSAENAEKRIQKRVDTQSKKTEEESAIPRYLQPRQNIKKQFKEEQSFSQKKEQEKEEQKKKRNSTKISPSKEKSSNNTNNKSKSSIQLKESQKSDKKEKNNKNNKGQNEKDENEFKNEENDEEEEFINSSNKQIKEKTNKKNEENEDDVELEYSQTLNNNKAIETPNKKNNKSKNQEYNDSEVEKDMEEIEKEKQIQKSTAKKQGNDTKQQKVEDDDYEEKFEEEEVDL